jgi:hypothetical protein
MCGGHGRWLAWKFTAPGAQSIRSDGDEIPKGAPMGEHKSGLLTSAKPGRLASLGRWGKQITVSRGDIFFRVLSATVMPV